MVDLRPDTSIYAKSNQGQMSIMDLLNTARAAQQLQTDRTITGIVGKNTDPQTGQVDYEGVRRDQGAAARSGSAPLLGPQHMEATSGAEHSQLGVAVDQLKTAASLLDPFTAPGANPTRAKIAPVLGQLAALKVPAPLIAPVLKARDGPELQSALLGLRQAMVGSRDVSTELPGEAAVPGQRTTQAGAEQQAVRGGVGLGPTGIPAPMLEDQQKAATFQDRTQPIVNLISTVRKMGPDAFGPASEEINTLKKTAAFFGAKIPDLDQVNDYDKAQKAMVQIATEAGMGGTDLTTLQAIHGNPNVTMRTATIEELAKTLYAQQAKQSAIFPLAQSMGIPNSQYQNFKIWANKNLDPRAFGFQMMSPDAQKKLVTAMSPSERKKFSKSLDVADKFMDKPPEGGWYVPHE